MEKLEQRLEAVENYIKMAGLVAKEVLTFEEATVYTGLSKSYLYKLTSGRKIPHYCPSGKLLYFEKKELDAWLLHNRISTDEEIEMKAQAYCMANKMGGKK